MNWKIQNWKLFIALPLWNIFFYNAVRAGDMEAVNKNCEEDSFLHLKGTGILSKNPLTNLKYHFVVTTAMLTRYCIDGGLESEQAYRLSDFYILKMDSCTTVRQIADLHHIMARDFTGKMILQKKSSILSRPVMQCVDYIYGHIKGAYHHSGSVRTYRTLSQLSVQSIQTESWSIHK